MATTFLEVVNNAESRLSAGINAAVVSMVVVDGSSFPSSFPFHVTVDAEIIAVGARAGNTLSDLTRGQQGTGAAAHSASTKVQLRVTAKSVADLNVTVNTLEDTCALLPGRAGGQTLIGGLAANEDLVLQATAHATRDTSTVQLFVDTFATMELSATKQTFGPAIVAIQFDSVTQVDFMNVLATEIVRFSDATNDPGRTPPVDFQAGMLAVNEDLDIAGDIDVTGHAAFGAGGNVVANNILVAKDTYTGTSTPRGLNIEQTVNYAGAAAANAYACELRIILEGATVPGSSLRGIQLSAEYAGTGAAPLPTLVGAEMTNKIVSTHADGGVTSANAVRTGINFGSGAFEGTVVAARGILIQNAGNPAAGGTAGSIDTLTGLRISNQTRATNGPDNFAIQALGGNITFFTSSIGDAAEDVIGIGNRDAAPTSSPANMVQLYAEDVSASSELKVRDEGGTVTVLSDLVSSLTGECDCPMPIEKNKLNVFLGLETEIRLCCLAQTIQDLVDGRPLTQRTIIAHKTDHPRESWAENEAFRLRDHERCQEEKVIDALEEELGALEAEPESRNDLDPVQVAKEAALQAKITGFRQLKTYKGKKARAAKLGFSLTDYILRPDPPEWIKKRLAA